MKLIIASIILTCSIFSSRQAKICPKQRSDTDEPKGFDKQGHRGCRGLMPENTIPAMIKALQLGVTTLEMDAHITNDSLVVISHDPFMNADISTKPDGSYVTVDQQNNFVLYRMNYDEIRQFDVGIRPYPRFPRQVKINAYKPLLTELIDSVEAYSSTHDRALPFYNIETKCLPQTDDIYHPKPDVFVRLLMNVILLKKISERVIIQSFDPRTLKIVHAQYPGIRTALLIDSRDHNSLATKIQRLGFNPSIYSPEYSLVNSSLIDSCHAFQMKIIPWTVDDKIAMAGLHSLGVDGIISDYPDLYASDW